MIDLSTAQQLAARLYEAEKTLVPLPPYTENGYADLSYDDAYAIQIEAMKMKLKDGRRVIGKKIGLSNKKVQEKRGISEPDFGYLFEDRIWCQDEPLHISKLMVAPSVECEIAFLMKRDLQGPGVTAAQVIAATDGILPAIEIVERRFFPVCKNVKDSIADNAAFGRLIVGNKIISPKGIDLRTIGCVIEKNGVPVETAAGAAVLGNPAEAVAWLVNKLSEYGDGLKAREIVLSGSVGSMYTAAAGDCYYAFYGDGLGSVRTSFIP